MSEIQALYLVLVAVCCWPIVAVFAYYQGRIKERQLWERQAERALAVAVVLAGLPNNQAEWRPTQTP